MKQIYLIPAIFIMSSSLNATILREPPQGCPSIADINLHKSELVKAQTNQTIQMGSKQFRIVYLTHSQPSTSINVYTNAIINPNFSGKAKCDYAIRAPHLGMMTHYVGLERVK